RPSFTCGKISRHRRPLDSPKAGEVRTGRGFTKPADSIDGGGDGSWKPDGKGGDERPEASFGDLPSILGASGARGYDACPAAHRASSTAQAHHARHPPAAPRRDH